MAIYNIGGNRISEEAEIIATNILKKAPMDQLKYVQPFPYIKPYLMRPLSAKIEFVSTASEKEVMALEAKKYNLLNQEDPLIVHGTKGSPSILCQILIDGNLYHNNLTECYGDLGADKNQGVNAGGYYDTGWGIFVAKKNYIIKRKVASKSLQSSKLVVPLEGLEGIVVPTQIAPILREEFSKYSSKIFGYQGFAAKIRGVRK